MAEMKLKRVSLLIPEEDYELLISESEANLSHIIRTLIKNHLSPHKIELEVSEETKGLYDIVVANEAAETTEVIENHIKQGLKKLLSDKISKLEKLKSKI